jgi:phosphoenolpyruvate synthase/pyruvate phosphate dikinase
MTRFQKLYINYPLMADCARIKIYLDVITQCKIAIELINIEISDPDCTDLYELEKTKTELQNTYLITKRSLETLQHILN